MAERTIQFQLKAVDDDAGTFEGYGSVFHTVDSQKDRVMPGAFKRSLDTRGAQAVKLLWQHDHTQPIGVYEEIAEDEKGLRVRGRLLIGEVQKAREAYALMKARALDGLSIGYRPIKFTKNEKYGTTDLLDVDLFEISPVTFPANGDARITGVKGDDMTDKQDAVELVEKAKLEAAQAVVADLEQKQAAAAPLLSQVAALTGKAEPTEQMVALEALAQKAARVETLEKQVAQDERAALERKADEKKIPPADRRSWQHLPNHVLAQVIEAHPGMKAYEGDPAAQRRTDPAQPADSTQTTITITDYDRAFYKAAGITDDAQIAAAKAKGMQVAAEMARVQGRA